MLCFDASLHKYSIKQWRFSHHKPKIVGLLASMLWSVERDSTVEGEICDRSRLPKALAILTSARQEIALYGVRTLPMPWFSLGSTDETHRELWGYSSYSFIEKIRLPAVAAIS